MSDDLRSFLLQLENERVPATKLETLPLGTFLHGLTHFRESNCIHAHCFVMKYEYTSLKILSRWALCIHVYKNTVAVAMCIHRYKSTITMAIDIHRYTTTITMATEGRCGSNTLFACTKFSKSQYKCILKISR